MSKIKIITDSCCDLTKEVIDELGIKVLPFTVTIGGKEYRELFDISTEEMYEKMAKTDEIPKHAQITPLAFADAYQEALDEGYTDVICVSINSKGSGTYRNACFARDEFFENNPDAKDKINIINLDSTCYSIFYGYPIIEAVKKIRKGANVDEVVAYLQEWFENCAIYAVPYNLKYAKKSGRISAASAFAGELLGLKPVILFDNGETTTVEKIRGEKNIVSKLCDLLEKNMTPQTPYIILRGKDTVIPKEFEKEMTKRTGRKAEMTNMIGAVVTSNIGPELIAVLFRKKNQ